MSQEEFKKLDEIEQDTKQEKIEELKEKLKDLIMEMPLWEKETREQFKELNTEFAKSSVKPFLKALMDKYSETPEVKSYLDIVSKDIVENMQYFLPMNANPGLNRRASGLEGTPIVYENNPTYNNLIGRIEHIAQDGALITDFTLIKPGALHQANGGYLILDMQNLLMNPFAWEGLKRTLYAKEIRMQSLERMLSTVSTVTLEPEAIPLNVKVVLVGDRYLYYLLKTYDPEFNELFKATADFSESFERNETSVNQLAQARIIEHCSRETGDAEKLSLHRGKLKDLIVESDYWAGKDSKDNVEVAHVQSAIDSRIRRADQMQEQVREQILRDIVLIDTEGECVGQINGLSVYQLGDFSFGQPSRITATARLGHGNVLDIEARDKAGRSDSF
ncbi:putative Lon protease [Nymphon striatum]|nr:putative Lon protease [Nymphon striatum]